MLQKFSICKLSDGQQGFKNFLEALYAVDVTFQKSYLPSDAISEGKLYLCSKNKLYALKVEVSVLPNGLVVLYSSHFPGSVSDFEIILHCREFHTKLLQKKETERPWSIPLCIGYDIRLNGQCLLAKSTKDCWKSCEQLTLYESLQVVCFQSRVRHTIDEF